jgi:uncharacterized membrane protein
MAIRDLIEVVGLGLDAAGVAVIVVAVTVAGAAFVRAIGGGRSADDAYRDVRRTIGRGILLGLELLVAGDIIRTVAVDPSFTSVGVLALIVAIRTFLSFSLQVELTGRWPWQARPASTGGAAFADDA